MGGVWRIGETLEKGERGLGYSRQKAESTIARGVRSSSRRGFNS